MPDPTVKLTPDFKVGETVYCKATRAKFKVLAITKSGDLSCAGRAGLMPASAAAKELPKQDED